MQNFRLNVIFWEKNKLKIACIKTCLSISSLYCTTELMFSYLLPYSPRPSLGQGNLFYLIIAASSGIFVIPMKLQMTTKQTREASMLNSLFVAC